ARVVARACARCGGARGVRLRTAVARGNDGIAAARAVSAARATWADVAALGPQAPTASTRPKLENERNLVMARSMRVQTLRGGEWGQTRHAITPAPQSARAPRSGLGFWGLAGAARGARRVARGLACAMTHACASDDDPRPPQRGHWRDDWRDSTRGESRPRA